ncbi:MAG: choice-of-anchor Q domain-containing protein [Cypionkella sp.]
MAIFYVAPNGSDSAIGSSASPFKTINEALSANLKPGDEIVVRAGTYNETVNVDKGGSAAGDITIRAEVPGQALIRPGSGYDAIDVNANYVTIKGFDIAGAKGDGIQANGVHHISILDNTVHGNGESGIQFNYSDFIRVEGNETYANASSGWFSGISIYQNRNITGDTSTDGFRTIVRNNVTYDNVTTSGEHTDGNGIIIDDFQSTQTSGYPNYTFATLVDGNVSYGNGGKGIQVAWSDHVTVSNNTAYHNNVDAANSGTWRGEISNAQSSNNVFINNIAVADDSVNSNNTAFDNNSYGGYVNQAVVFNNNILFNGTAGQLSVRNDGGNNVPTAGNSNLIGVNPQFVDASHGDFEVTAGSKAIDAGTAAFGLGSTDVDGDARVVGTVDIGAHEFGSGPVVGTLDTIGEAGRVEVNQTSRGQWHTVTFAEALDNPSVVMGPMTTNGGQPATIEVRNVTGTGFQFQIHEWDYLDGPHVTEKISWMAIEAGTHTLANGQVVTAGSTTASDAVTKVTFDAGTFGSNPLVMAQVTSDNQTVAVTDRIGAVGTNGFQVMLDQQDANTGHLKAETVSWIALDAGNGSSGGLLAGSLDSVDNKGGTLSMPGAFGSDQFAFIADMQTHRGPDAATLALSDLATDGVSIFVQEERSADSEINHVAESVGYVAMDFGLIHGDTLVQ